MAGELKIVRATMDDRPRIVAFLRANFYKDEPLNIAMGLTDEPTDADVNHSVKSLPENKSLMAFLDDVLVGVAINGEIADNEVGVREKMCEECECPDFTAFLKFWVQVEKMADFWKSNDVQRAFDLEILAVDAATRGRGVGGRLFTAAMALAKELGYEVMRVDCSSYYAAQLAEQKGMKCVFAYRFDEYKDEEGLPVFKIYPPHEEMKIYMYRLCDLDSKID